MKKPVLLTAALLLLSTPAPAATQVDIPGPPGSGWFGTSVTVLPNGNFVVTDAFYGQPNPPVGNIGAVYLFTPEGALISTLRGEASGDKVGKDGVTVLANGNFVVCSDHWNGGRGAVTWGSATTGFIGGANVTVSPANSLVGSTEIDLVGRTGVLALANGHYVVCSRNWDNGAAIDAGAVTWGNGFTGTVGVVSAANSLVGTTNNDQVGGTGITALTNGHYVVRSHMWDNGPVIDAGAVTWGNGFGGTTGPVSANNSLVGTTADEQVGLEAITVLSNGHYVHCSPLWDNGAAADAGAVTWCNGFTGTVGVVSAANSLVGTNNSDQVGGTGITALTNGHYVVRSANWNRAAPAVVNAGAVTWCNGFGGTVGPVTAANSLVGSSPSDSVGSTGVTALGNGNYVVSSALWDNGPVTNAGAVTWGDGRQGARGPVTAANSLVGTTAQDQVGSSGIFVLTNGNYVVRSIFWDNGPAANAGAVTWGNGRKGSRGPVTAANSLVGSSAADLVGLNGVTALSNGNYVVSSALWDNGTVTNAGAATWGDGSKGITGHISRANSLVGTTIGDEVGGSGTTALANGNYVVCSELWDNIATAVANAGAATWGDGSKGIKGPVTAANSLHGTQDNDLVGSDGATALPSGHYLVLSRSWKNGAVSFAGAITWCNGTTITTGSVSAANSLVGSTSHDGLGSSSPVITSDGNVLYNASSWNNGVTTNAGAISFIDGQRGATGPIRSANSVFGTLVGEGGILTFDYDPARKQLMVGRRKSNLVTLFRGDRLRSLGKSGQDAPGPADIAFGKPGSAAVNPDGSLLADFSLIGTGAKGKNRALFAFNPATGSDLVLQTGTPLSALGGGLPANATATALFGQIFNHPSLGIFQTTFKGTNVNPTNNRLLLRDNGASVSLLHRSGSPIAPLGGAAIASFKEVLQCHDQNRITVAYKLKPGGGVTKGNDEGLLFLDHSGVVQINVAAREGQPAFGGGGDFGAFTGRAAAGIDLIIQFTALFRPTGGKPVPAVFATNADGLTTDRYAVSGDPAPASGGATYRTFPALSQLSGQALVKATLKGSPAGQNEGLYLLPANTLITRKGDDIGGGTLITRLLRFWPAGPGQVLLLAQLGGTGGNSQALVLRQIDSTYLILLRTGQPAPGVGSARLKAISAVDVNPVSGRYAILGTLSGSPASANQALWTGDPTLGDDTPANQILRLPQLTLRKGHTYTTDATPQGTIRSLALKPAVDPTGGGGRGLAQALGAADDLALFITGDRKLTEVVLLDR